MARRLPNQTAAITDADTMNYVEDVAAFLVARARLAGMDSWEAERVAQVAAEARRRRDQHRRAGAAPLARIRGRGESLAAADGASGVSRH